MNKEDKNILLIILGLVFILFLLGSAHLFYLRSKPAERVFCLEPPSLSEEDRLIWQEEADLLLSQIEAREAISPSQCSLEQILRGECAETDTAALDLRQGTIYSVLGEPERALEMYRSVYSYWNQLPGFWNLVAHEEMTLCHYDQAKTSLTRALDLAPNDIEAWQRLIFIEKNSPIGATGQNIRRLYRQALTATNNNLELMTNWARWLEMQGDEEEAIEIWREMIGLYPDQEQAIQREIERMKTSTSN